MVEDCYVIFQNPDEYDLLAEYLDGLGFTWAMGNRISEWHPNNMYGNCLHIEPSKNGNVVYQLAYIPPKHYQTTFYQLPFISTSEFLGLHETFRNEISFEAVMGL